MATPKAGKNGSFWTEEVTGSALLSNLGFDVTGVTHWTKGEAKTTGVYDGAGAAFVTGGTTMLQTGPATSGSYYVASAMCKMSTGSTGTTGQAYLKLAFLSGGVMLTSGTDTVAVTGANSWVRYSVIRRATNGHTDELRVSFETSTDNDLYVDDVRCVKLEQVGGFSNWSFDVGYDTHDTTSFEDDGWRTFGAGLQQWSASATRFWSGEDLWNALTGGSPIYCVFYAEQDSDMTGNRWEGLAHIHGITVNTPVDSVITSDLTIQGTKAVTYITD